MANTASTDPRFVGVQFPVWFGRKEMRLSSKILDQNSGLTPYDAMVAAAGLCNSGENSADEYLKADHVDINPKRMRYPPLP